MFTRKVPLVAAFLCGILLLMAGVAPAWAQSETPTSPDAEPAAAPEAAPEAVPSAIDEAPSQYISYQGTLRDSSGNPDNGTHAMSVAIYDNAAASGTALFTQSFTGVQVRNGHFSLLFSSVGPAVFSGKDRFLQLTVDGTALTPTQRLAPVPYAVSSNYANSLAAPDGDPLAPISVNNDGNVTVANPYTLNFGSSTRQMVNLWGTTYGIGVQGYTQYFRSDRDFAWYMDGVHSDTRSDPGTGGTVAMLLNDSGNLGIGTASPDRRVTVQAANTNGEWLSFRDSAGTTQWHINSKGSTGLNIAESGVADGRLFIKDGGNVGIGTTNPQAKLDVRGDVWVNGHKPVVFKTYYATDHCYWHVWGDFSATTWSCGIVSFTVKGDINERDKQYPLMQAAAYVADGTWHFRVEASDSCGEDWQFTVMCIDNNLVSWSGDKPTGW